MTRTHLTTVIPASRRNAASAFRDARVIARRISDADLFLTDVPVGVYADLRELTVARQQQRVQLNQLLNQLRTILDQCFPEFAQVFVDPLGLAATFLLLHYPFPADPLGSLLSDLPMS